MTPSRCDVQEERWIDWHLKRLPPETAEALERHALQCEDCRRVSSQWAAWLGESAQQANDSVPPMPREHIRQSLRLRVRRMGWRNRMQRLRLRPVWQLAAAGAALLFGLFAFQHVLPDSAPGRSPAAVLDPMDYVERHVPEGVKLMSLPDTQVFGGKAGFDAVWPEAAAGNRSVTVWLNGRTGEVLVLIEGLLPTDSRDVQAWGTIREARTNLGLLEFHQARGHLYRQSLNVPEVEELALTIEPKGGSLLPTLPETARIRLVDLR